MQTHLQAGALLLSFCITAACQHQAGHSEVAADHLANSNPPSHRVTADVFDLAKEQAAAVDTATLARAAAIIFGLTYIPEWFIDEHCDVRAYYYGAELAAQRIPANQIYVFPNSGATLSPRAVTPSRLPRSHEDANLSTLDWVFHTAPFFFVEGVEMVIDPLQSPAPLTVDQWLANMGVTRNEVKVFIRPFSNLAGIMTPRTDSFLAIEPAATLSQFPKMKDSELEPLCRSLASDAYSANADNGWTAANKAFADQIGHRIYTRSDELYATLRAAGLATGAADAGIGGQCQEDIDNGDDGE